MTVCFSWYGEGALAKCVLHNRHNWMESISTMCTFRHWVEIALRKCMAITVFGTCAYNQPSKRIWWKFWLEMSIDIKYLHCFTRKTNNTLNSVNSMTWIRYAFNPLKMSIINAHAYNFLIFKPNEYPDLSKLPTISFGKYFHSRSKSSWSCKFVSECKTKFRLVEGDTTQSAVRNVQLSYQFWIFSSLDFLAIMTKISKCKCKWIQKCESWKIGRHFFRTLLNEDKVKRSLQISRWNSNVKKLDENFHFYRKSQQSIARSKEFHFVF